MGLSLTLHLTSASLLLFSSSRVGATPLPFNTSAEGSGEAQPQDLAPTIFATRTPVSASTFGGPLQAMPLEKTILNQVSGFLQENLLLSIAVPSLLVATILLLCCASAMGRKRKSNAYYPSSFPAQKYVDERDKVGGTGTFSEVPERPVDSQHARPVDSAKQLQADIRNAAKNLRTPTKSPAGETGERETSPQPTEVKGQMERPAAVSEGTEGVDVSPGPPAEMSRVPEEHPCPTRSQDARHNPAKDALLEGDSFGQEAETDKPPMQEAQEEGTSLLEPAQKDEDPPVQLITAETAAF